LTLILTLFFVFTVFVAAKSTPTSKDYTRSYK